MVKPKIAKTALVTTAPNCIGKRSTSSNANPFPPALWARAIELARGYQLVITPDLDLGYLGRTIEMPFAMSDGATIEACAAATIDAAACGIATMLEIGDTPPAPSREGKREQQVNIRLTAEEKFRLEQAAQTAGYRSLSDFIRAVAVKSA